MNVGMLWFDNDPRMGFEGKVARAADYYRTKYGRKATLCFVHPSMLAAQMPAKDTAAAPVEVDAAADQARVVADGVEVRTNRSVMPNHFWIGVNGPNDSSRGQAASVAGD
jgi:hypothetical protein